MLASGRHRDRCVKLGQRRIKLRNRHTEATLDPVVDGRARRDLGEERSRITHAEGYGLQTRWRRGVISRSHSVPFDTRMRRQRAACDRQR